MLLLLLLLSCAHNPASAPVKGREEAPAGQNSHAGVIAEWAPHHKVTEWWYATGVLESETGQRFFYQFTIFHGWKLNLFEGFTLHLSLTDFAGGRHYFYQDSWIANREHYADAGRVVFKDSSIGIVASGDMLDRLKISGNARADAEEDSFSFELQGTPEKGHVWHGDDGVIVMGHEDNTRERSFYYSWTKLHTTGSLVLNGNTFSVSGSSWFDRQWGKFTELYWEWFSLRLDDNREIMLFHFPDTGYMAGTMVLPDGTYYPLEQSGLEGLGAGSLEDGKHHYDLGWKLTANGEEFSILPVLDKQSNLAEWVPSYWEGLCTVTDAAGNRVGWCVVESTSPLY